MDEAALDDLRGILAERARLDERELDLVDAARRAGATWSQIAEASGLSSRQAAEQRRQRLAAAVAREVRAIDGRYGDAVVRLRRAVTGLHRMINADPRWHTRFVRAGLVRETVGAAVDAVPGSLFALAAQADADLAEADLSAARAPVRAAAAELHRALQAARDNAQGTSMNH